MKRIVECATQYLCEEPSYGRSRVWQSFKAPNSITHTALQIVHEGATIKTTFRESGADAERLLEIVHQLKL
jgi:hypothetical protein